MPQVRGTVTVIYSCGLLVAMVVLSLLIYVGVFDGFWAGLFEILKDTAKYLVD